MGGGDLNTKKSWHPNTMKNQERVWKAEQAAAEEQKRIQQLMVERNQEKDRSELNDLARKRNEMQSSDDVRLGWMYERPDKQIQQEDYLLGKAIDKNFDKDENADKNVIPAVARRVVGSSMLSSTSDTQVDITRKMREDPLLMVKERERAARAALLNNPLQRKKIAELLRKEQEQKQTKKSKELLKNKHDDLDRKLAEKLGALSGKKDLASLLCSDDDDSSDDSSPKAKKKKKKKRKSKKKTESESDKPSKKRNKKREVSNHSSDEDSSPRKICERDGSQKEYCKNKSDSRNIDQSKHFDSGKFSKDDRNRNERDHHDTFRTHHKSDKKHKCASGAENNKYERQKDESRYSEKRNDDRKIYDIRYEEKRNNDCTRYVRQEESRTDRNNDKSSKETHRDIKRNKDERITTRERHGDISHASSRDKERRTESFRNERQRSEEKKPNDFNNRKRKSGLTDEEKAARLSAMSAAGAERERDRARRVAASVTNSETDTGARSALPPPRAALPESLEARIHSNRHNIQRNERHMDQHFARR